MSRTFATEVTPALEGIVAKLSPGARLLRVSPFGVDDSAADDAATLKGTGYGVPLRLDLLEPDGSSRTLVFHTEKADAFGHDRRADRAADMLLAFDRFGEIPRHVRALDVGAIGKGEGELVSLAGVGEFYLITSYAPGRVYADHLRTIAERGVASPVDVACARSLAELLADIHSTKHGADPQGELRYRRAIRDLVGSGEGIFGLCDAYAPDVPGAPPDRLRAIEERCLAWRWKLKHKSERLCRTHGDFHPFNILVDDDGAISLLDASRGCRGDAADDVACLAINYLFFAVERPETWRAALRPLYLEFLAAYQARARDAELLAVCAPFFAWRGLVVANPVWYPGVSERARDRVLSFVEQVLDAASFEPGMADAVFE